MIRRNETILIMIKTSKKTQFCVSLSLILNVVDNDV